MRNASIPPHAEPHDADALARDGGVRGEIVDRAAHVPARPVRREGLHQAPRLVRFGVPRQFAVIEIGRERHEPGGAESIRHLLDAGIEAPPFLDDQDAWTGTRSGRNEIPGRDSTIAGELNDFSHRQTSYSKACPPEPHPGGVEGLLSMRLSDEDLRAIYAI